MPSEVGEDGARKVLQRNWQRSTNMTPMFSCQRKSCMNDWCYGCVVFSFFCELKHKDDEKEKRDEDDDKERESRRS